MNLIELKSGKFIFSLFVALSCIFLTSNAQTPGAKIGRTWVQNNVTVNNVRGLNVHVALTVSGMRNHKTNVVVLFYDKNDKNVYAPQTESRYLSAEKHLWTWTSLMPQYDNTSYDDVSAFIPYSQFPQNLSGQTLHYKVFVNGIEKGWLPGQSPFIEFQLPNFNGNSSYPTSTASGADMTFTVRGVTFKMIRVEGGTFTMGEDGDELSPAFGDPHRVTLSSYYIGETEVTQALWKAVMGSNPSHFKGKNHPVENVSWEDCQTFISKLNSITGRVFRLPTEAEWEYAARGGNRSKGYQYSGSNTLGVVGWYEDNSGDKLHPVKKKQANELGLYDMSGNVMEWCSDWYDSFSSEAQTNPTGATSGSDRVIRGGCWDLPDLGCHVSYRYHETPNYHIFGIGLRLAL